VIACDGASSMVRSRVGIALEDLGFDQPWLVVDVMVTEQGAAKLPQVSIQYCEPQRPSTYLIGPGRHRRWEISINDDEDARQLATPEGAWKLLSRWITPDDGTLWRQASYRFHALVAERWRAGRVFVAGDAAHQQPPFLGQGMCQGIRDVANLAWKLQAVLREGASDALLDTYGAERKGHVQALTGRIKAIGQIIGERDVAAARARDAQLLAQCAGVVPSVPRQDVQPALPAGSAVGRTRTRRRQHLPPALAAGRQHAPTHGHAVRDRLAGGAGARRQCPVRLGAAPLPAAAHGADR
jgi:3-(3-hydroxy-phenyl)propionate hydroxylase